MFEPDNPIKSYKDDLLERHQFSQALGNAIISYKDKNSVAIGLFGAWGSGKSSIINMALEHVEALATKIHNKEKPIIVKFNPWNYSDQNQLIVQFFRELSVALRRKDYAGNAKKEN